MAALAPAWDELAAHALEPNPFYESWLLLPALEAFGLEKSFRLVTIWNGEQLDALLPLEHAKGFKGLPLQAFVSWRHRHCLLCTPLVRADGARETLAALTGLASVASIVNLQYIPTDGPFQQALISAGFRCVALDGYERPVLKRAKDGDAYINEFLSRKERQELRRREKRLQEQGKLTPIALGSGDDIERWIEEFLRLEAAGWKGKEGSAMICSDANRRFLTETFRAAHQRGRLQIVGIDLDGKPLARCTAFTAGEGSYAFKPAYDEAFAKFSPGIIAEVARIRHLHESPGVQWMDSFTDVGNSVLSRLWKDRVAVQSIAFGTSAAGSLSLAALPFLRWAKRTFSAASRGRARPAPARPQPASAR